MQIKEYINFENNVAFIQVKVIPKSARSEFFSVLDNGVLKIRIKAIPEKGKANKELISFLAKELKINKNKIEILGCKTEQVKRIKIILK